MIKNLLFCFSGLNVSLERKSFQGFNKKKIEVFGLFKKKTKLEKLESEYKKLLKEAFLVSTTNRKLSDAKTFEANEILRQIELIKGES